MTKENPNWGIEDKPEIPLYDQFTQFCDSMNQDFVFFDPIEIDKELQKLRVFLGETPLPRIGMVYTLSDSKLYDMLVKTESMSDEQLEIEAKRGQVIANRQADFSGEKLLEEVGELSTYIQSQIDTTPIMDVTVQVHHVYHHPWVETIDSIRTKAADLDGKILEVDELTSEQRRVLSLRPFGIPYNHSSGFIVRFANNKP